jgi:predicted extracellular nuclease
MRKMTFLGLVLALCVACTQVAAPTERVSAQLAIFNVPDEVTRIIVSFTGPEDREVTAVIEGGSASARVDNLLAGSYTVTARAFDDDDADAVVLYKSQAANVTIGEADFRLMLMLVRLASSITVTASPLSTEADVVIAQSGGVEARLLSEDNLASGRLDGVATGRSKTLLVNVQNRQGTLIQQGRASYRLSEVPETVSVTLQAVTDVQPPETPKLIGEDTVRQNAVYDLTAVVEDLNGADVTLTRLEVDWGDGSFETRELSGTSVSEVFTHSYSAAGERVITVTAENSAGLANQASKTISVLPVGGGEVELDFGPELANVTIELTNAPEGAERVQAAMTQEGDFGAAMARASYTLELIPRGDRRWSGRLNLPRDTEYSLRFTVTIAGDTVETERTRFIPRDTEVTITTPFADDGAPLPVCDAPIPGGSQLVSVSDIRRLSLDVDTTVTFDAVVTANFLRQAAFASVVGNPGANRQGTGMDGFFMQDPAGDPDDGYSDGIFVYIPPANSFHGVDVAAGEAYRVTARVSSFNGRTQVDFVSALDRCDEALYEIAPVTLSLPTETREDLFAFEGMLVDFSHAFTLTQNFFQGRYGQLSLSADGRLFQPNNGNDLGEDRELNSRRVIFLDDGMDLNALGDNPDPAPFTYLDDAGNPRVYRVGDTVREIVGILDFGRVSSFDGVNDFRIQPTQLPQFEVVNVRPEAPPAVGGELRVVAYNVLNYFTTFRSRGAFNQQEFERQNAKLLPAILALDADILGLIEIENNGGPGETPTSSNTGRTAIDELVSRLNAAISDPELRYAAISDPEFIGDDAIKQAIIYRPSRVTPVGTPLSSTDPAFTVGASSRPPVAQVFRTVGDEAGSVAVVVAHFKSKRCSPTPTRPGDEDTGEGCFSQTRVEQSQAVLALLEEIEARYGETDALVIGDLNAYGREAPILALLEAGLVDLMAEFVPAEARYSYVFSPGESGYLDHALATPSLRPQVTGAAFWAINADEPAFIDYATPPFKPESQRAFFAPDPFRSSDHDPVLVGLSLLPDDTEVPGDEVSELVVYSTQGLPGNQSSTPATTVLAGVSATDISRGPALGANGGNNSMNSNGWSTEAVFSADSGAYLSWTIAPEAGTLTLSEVRLLQLRSGTGPRTIELRSSLDGFSAPLASFSPNDSFPPAPIALSFAPLVSAGPLELRLYGYGATSANGTFRVADVVVRGQLE